MQLTLCVAAAKQHKTESYKRSQRHGHNSNTLWQSYTGETLNCIHYLSFISVRRWHDSQASDVV